jgi:thiamine kinase-like enzyme
VVELNDDILQRLEATLGPLAGEPVPLRGGITNRNYRVSLGGLEYVVRITGRNTELLGIDRGAERLACEGAAALGLAPAVAATPAEGLVTRFIQHHPLDSHQIADRVEELARSLRRFHDSPTVLPVSFWVPAVLERYRCVVLERGGTLPAAYEQALALCGRIAAALPEQRRCPCHDDLLAANIICANDGGRMLIVDWEYAGMGSPFFDLGNLSVNNGFDDATDRRLLRAYLGGEPTVAQRAQLKLMRMLSDAREAAWGVLQGELSELEFDFAGYATDHFERLREAAAQPSFERSLAQAGAVAREGGCEGSVAEGSVAEGRPDARA